MPSTTPGQSPEAFGSPRQSPSVSQYPFPSYEVSQKPVSTGLYDTRRNSTASSITSIGEVLGSAAQSKTISFAEAGNNAISTLLQPPIVRTGLLPQTGGSGAQKAPSTKDIPPVTLTNIPHIDFKAFQPYLSQAGSLYDAFQRAKEGFDDGGLTISRKARPSLKTDQVSGLLNQGTQRRKLNTPVTTPTSPVLSSPLDDAHTRGRANGGSPRRGLNAVTPISIIPAVYFEQDFHLENPRTFDIVSERSEIVRPPLGSNGGLTIAGSTGRKVLATNAILQEKLSWYMDTVEVHLISSISTASTSFFAALGSLRELHLEASKSVEKIQTLRKDLENLDRDMAVGGLRIVAMRKRRENMKKLSDAVEQLARVVEAVSLCEEQVENGDIEDALQGLIEVERLIRGQKDKRQSVQEADNPSTFDTKLVDLSGIKALEGAGNDISYLRKRIGKGFESRFLEALLGDLRFHVDTIPSAITFQRWDKASQRFRTNHTRTPSAFPAYLHIDDSLRSELRSTLHGLSQSESIMPATISYREAVLREVKTLIRRHLPSSSDDDNESTMSASTQGGRQMTQQDKSLILARNLRALGPEESEELLEKIYSNVGEALRRLGTQVKVVLDVTSSFNVPPPTVVKSPSSPLVANMEGYHDGALPTSHRLPFQQEEIQQALDMSHLLGQAVDIAQAQITKILKVRSDQNTHLPLHRFLRYFHLNRLFADECEAVSGRGGAALKTVVNAHIKEFVTQFADGERQRLVQGMDADRWDAKDFTDSHRQILNRILEGSTRDVDAWTKACLIWEKDDEAMIGGLEANVEITNGDEPLKDKIRSAVIDEQKYILPESAFTVLRGIERFENLIAGIPSMTQEITSFLLEYLGLFNSRSQQLILGAGATRIAGLKNITTKHLALASQALSFVTALTPHVREFARRHSSGSGVLMIEFDKMKREYQEHQAGINDKLVDIMSGRATAHVNVMKKLDWDAAPSNKAVNAYMETLVKETATLHKVLSKHLPDISVRMIMEPVFGSYKEQLGKAFQDVAMETLKGKESMLRDAEYFKYRIGKLDGAANLGDHLVRVAHDKVIPRPESPQQLSQDAANPSEQAV